jgi:predicted ATPase/class 3 adenylate cyclase
MFCDLVGSTELSTKLDPEDMREVIISFQDTSREAIQQYAGFIARYMGDGMLVYFGYPQAHEDDAERAVRAGLAIVRSMAKLNAGIGKLHEVVLAVRVGVATGSVVVGDIIGEGAAEEAAVVGETPNVAARLQGLAEPNTVIVSDRTRRLAGDVFHYDDLGAHDVKGLSEPILVFRATVERVAASRFEAMHRTGLTPFVGRVGEIELLTRCWEEAKDGDGQVVFLSGEPGIGKSRITGTFHDRVAGDPHTFLLYQCSPFYINSAFYPVIDQLERSVGLDREADPDAKLGKLEASLVRSADDARESVALLAALLSLPTDRYPPLNMSPQKQKERTIEVLVEQITLLARTSPVLIVFEDVHWIDPTTLEAINHIISAVSETRVLLVVTFRPEFTPPWGSHSHISAHALHRLGRRASSMLVGKVTGEKSLPGELMAQIVAKADGVPLFIEELTKAVLESDILVDAGDRYELSGAIDAVAIPDTLHDSLMARLDRLIPVKEVAQIGAAIGREFSYRLVAALSPRSEVDLDAALDKLVASDLVHRKGNPPEAEYTFKHALVQDAAYDSLLKRDRQQLHTRIAAALLEHFPTTAETEPELLAHHYSEAGLVEPAITYWLRAGQQATQRAANLEAIQYFQQALALLETLPEDRARDTTELKVLTHLGPALMVIKGWAAQEVGTVYERANELASRLETSADLVPPLVGIWLFHNARGRYDLADAVTEQLFYVARSTSDEDVLLQAHHAGWPILMFRGAFESANEHIEKGLELYDYERHKGHALIYMGHDPAVCAHACGAQTVWALGLPDRAERHGMQAIELARRVVHAPTLAFALWYVSAGHAARGDAGAVLAATEELLPLSQEQKLVQLEASAHLLGGWALAATGNVKEGLERMSVGFDAWNGTGNRTWLHVFTCLYGDGLLRDRRHAEALEALDQALEIGRQTGERRWESRIHHLRGEALLYSGDADSAVESLQMAIQVARTQHAKSWELRAATRLAMLWAEQGKREDSLDLLAPIYGWFTEGFDTADLKEAKALLEELS